MRAVTRWPGAVAGLVLALASLPIAGSQSPPSPAEAPIVETRHRVTVDGRVLAYTARAGRLPIRDNETGAPHAWMFFTAYRLDPPPDGRPRPLTFLWNGGPGANSSLVHFEGFGPKRIAMPDTPTGPPGCDCELIPNDGTWLEATDLVFVDPIGTGFSRLADSEYAPQFYSVLADTASVTEFIRLYLTRFDAWDQPLFLAGESYGTWRAAGVALALERRAIAVAGTILISGGVPVGSVETEPMRVAHLLTARTAAAFAHQRLAPDLQRDLDATLAEAERWAREAYAPALARRESLSPSARTAIVEGLSRYTGLAPGRIDREALVINRQEFAAGLLADQDRELARFDTRLLADADRPPDGARAHLLGRHLRESLGVRADGDLAFLGLERGFRPVTQTERTGPAAEWRYDQAPRGEEASARLTTGDGPPGDRPAWLRETIEANPRHQVFVATGHFDSLNSCALNRHVVGRLDADLRDNFTLACYAGGHMMYEDRDVRLRLQDDIARFIASAVSMSAPAGPWPPALGQIVHTWDRDVVSSTQAIDLEVARLTYTARAGTLPIRHTDTGEVHANMFFVSYAVPGPAGDPRPIVFAWNGGPGSNAGLLHVTAMGPRRLRMGDVYPDADHEQMNVMVDNEATWLDFADLVFVDPVGTGYSRPTRAEYGPDFYDTTGDVESIAEFIRVYRTRFDAWDQPVFLAGESYGSRRAAAVADTLQRRGIDVAGLVLISGHLGIGSLPPAWQSALIVPSYTATAIYHRKLAPELQRDAQATLGEVERWAREVYAPALERLDRLTAAERQAIERQLARYTGLSPDAVDATSLTVPMPAFADRLLAAEGRVLGRYDSRLSRPRRAGEAGPFDPRADASLAPLEGKMSGSSPAMNRYLRRMLGYESDLLYIGPFGGGWPPPASFRGDWMSVRWNRDRPGPEEPLRDAMNADPSLRVFEAAGIYDLVIPYLPPGHIIEQLEPSLRARFSRHAYTGGHSFYLDRAARMQFKQDARAFVDATTAGR